MGQDLGDSIYDSTVFLDRFFWSTDVTCTSGAASDTDGDGLLDTWESAGLTVGGVFVDLPAMGADPMHKDIFVEIDNMGASSGHDHAPAPNAIQMIVDAFNAAPVSNPDGNTGIHLHVDYGSTAPLTWGAAATWGSLSQSNVLTHQQFISTCTASGFNWSGFDTLKAANFANARAGVFHYNIWGHSLCSSMAGTSGISRNGDGATFGDGASDFIVSLGAWTGGTGTTNEQAGTFMHELGHNLGLRHGGDDHTQWKPNYLSVMNYSFQTRGLLVNNTFGNFDYSRYDLADLNENNLNETVGVNVPGTVTDILGTIYFCALDLSAVDMDARQVDWNCNGDALDTSVSRNINQGVSWNNNATLGTLTSQNDWDNLVFTGGAVGAPGAVVVLPDFSDIIDVDVDQNDDIPGTTDDVDLWVLTNSFVGVEPEITTIQIPIKYSNYGLSTAISTTLTVILSDNLTYLSDDSGLTPTVNGNTLTWELGDLGLTQGGFFNLFVEIPSSPLGTSFTLDLEIMSEGPEADPADNTASVQILVANQIFLPNITR